jgi:hypothetical protein
LLAKFKKSLIEYTGSEIIKLDVRIRDALENKKKVLKERELSEAVAQARAEAAVPAPRGLLGSFF